MRPRLTKGERAYQKALSILLSLPEYYQQKAYIELRSRMPQIKTPGHVDTICLGENLGNLGQ